MFRKLIVLAVIASFALMPTGASATHQGWDRVHATSNASTNDYFFSSDICSTEGEAYTWLRQAGGEFSASGITPTTGAVIQEFDAIGTTAFGEAYFHDAGGTEAFEFGFEGMLECQSESVAVITGSVIWGNAYEFPDTGDLCTPLDSVSGSRVLIRVNFETQESSIRVAGFFAEDETTTC